MLGALGPEQEIALRVAHLAATRLAGGEQGFEGANVGVFGRQLAQERARARRLASAAMGAVSTSTEWKASKSSRRLASSAVERADRVRRAQQAAREAMDAIGEMIIGARHGDEFGEAAIGIGFLFAQHFHLALDQRDGGAGAHVRQAHAREQRLVTFEEVGIET